MLDPVNHGIAEWQTTGVFGRGMRVLGHFKAGFTARLNGRRSTSRPVRFLATTEVSHVLMEGNRYYYDSSWPQGHHVRPSVYDNYLHTPNVVPADNQIEWPGFGYEAFQEHPVQVGAVFAQWKWRKPGAPGHWYLYAKSVHYYFRGKNAHYYKQWKNRLGQLPSGIGGVG